MNVKTLYVIPTARYSIGATQHSFAEKEYQRRMLDTVLSMTGDDSPFRWTCASAAVVSDYLRSADDITKKTFYSTTSVTFYDLSEEEIKNYVATNSPFDKAGGYGIQDEGALFVKKINGDFYNVMGLPIAKLSRILKQLK